MRAREGAVSNASANAGDEAGRKAGFRVLSPAAERESLREAAFWREEHRRCIRQMRRPLGLVWMVNWCDRARLCRRQWRKWSELARGFAPPQLHDTRWRASSVLR
jgi:hypothetical protein